MRDKLRRLKDKIILVYKMVEAGKKNAEDIERLKKEIKDLRKALGTTVLVASESYDKMIKLEREMTVFDKIITGIIKYIHVNGFEDNDIN